MRTNCRVPCRAVLSSAGRRNEGIPFHTDPRSYGTTINLNQDDPDDPEPSFPRISSGRVPGQGALILGASPAINALDQSPCAKLRGWPSRKRRAPVTFALRSTSFTKGTHETGNLTVCP